MAQFVIMLLWFVIHLLTVQFVNTFIKDVHHILKKERKKDRLFDDQRIGCISSV